MVQRLHCVSGQVDAVLATSAAMQGVEEALEEKHATEGRREQLGDAVQHIISPRQHILMQSIGHLQEDKRPGTAH